MLEVGTTKPCKKIVFQISTDIQKPSAQAHAVQNK